MLRQLAWDSPKNQLHDVWVPPLRWLLWLSFSELHGRCLEIDEHGGIPPRDLNMFKTIFCWAAETPSKHTSVLENEEATCLTLPLVRFSPTLSDGIKGIRS